MALERWKPRHDGYCAAQICENGHVITTRALRADDLRPFCSQCGRETFVKCRHCGETIRGDLPAGEEGAATPPYVEPSYCPACGRAYPWTETRLETARGLAAELEGLSVREQRQLLQSLDDLMADTPRASLAALQFERLIARARGAGLRALRDLVRDVTARTREPVQSPPAVGGAPT